MKQQAISWMNTDPILGCHTASSESSELKNSIMSWHSYIMHLTSTDNIINQDILWLPPYKINALPGARPTNDISIEFEIRTTFAVLWFKIFSINHNKILHRSRHCNCRDMCKILLWSVKHISNQSAPNFDWISNLIEISLMRRAPGWQRPSDW